MDARTDRDAELRAAVGAERAARWYQDAVVYQTHVKAYFDSDDDGVGDFTGLTAKLDYVRDLGVDAIWLLPFYPSPLRDDGYDIANYRGVHPQYGTLADFRRFLAEAHARGLRVITELVINHTSDQNGWFQAARRAPRGSPEREFYVWSDDPAKYADARIIFTDTEKSNWTWDEVAQQYYWHRFFSHQPDLNFDNPRVIDAIVEIMRYWLDLGVDGLRLDAIPYLIEREGTSCENLPETHAILKRLRAELDVRHADRMFLAEANQWPEDVRAYFGDGDECHMAYHFPLMPRMYMAIAQEDRHPIIDILSQTPAIPDACQWAIFLRNHDELTLEMVTDRERDYMYRQYAADARARINLGIRRRLAPLMENDGARIRLMNALLLSMPGSPILYYGDELGMGDNIYLGDRNGVRTPMQWSPDRNGGFSRADPQGLYLPPIMDPIYGYGAVNVESQLREPGSLLNWTRRMLAVRRGARAFGRGSLTFVRPGNRKILAYLREYESEIVLVVANLARTAQPVELDLARFAGRVPVEMLGRTPFPPIGSLPYLLTLPGHHCYWFRLETDVPAPAWHVGMLTPDDLPVLVLFEGWDSLEPARVAGWRRGLSEAALESLETRVLPPYMAAQRWYGARGEPPARARLAASIPWTQPAGEWLLAFVDVDAQEGRPAERWFLPLSLVWEDGAAELPNFLRGAVLARARRHARVGWVADAMLDPRFVASATAAIADGLALRTSAGTLQFRATSAFGALAGHAPEALACRPLGANSQNTTVALGERLVLKCFRRLRPGVNPEVEVGEFLTTVVPYAHTARIAGTLEHHGDDGTLLTLGVLEEYVPNQGDGRCYAREHLVRVLERHASDGPMPAPEDEHGGFLAMMRTLGERVAELHLALATPSGHAQFEPEPVTVDDRRAWASGAIDALGATFELLAQRRESLPPEVAALAERVLGAREVLAGVAQAAAVGGGAPAFRARLHGDLDLGQVLIVKDDFAIIDFEGNPAQPIEARRAKRSQLRDVAGMLRSFEQVRASALRHLSSVQPSGRHAQVARLWLDATIRAFLDAYRARLAQAGRGDEGPQERALIALFELEFALRDLARALASRVDEAAEPLESLLRVAGAHAGDAQR